MSFFPHPGDKKYNRNTLCKALNVTKIPGLPFFDFADFDLLEALFSFERDLDRFDLDLDLDLLFSLLALLALSFSSLDLFSFNFSSFGVSSLKVFSFATSFSLFLFFGL